MFKFIKSKPQHSAERQRLQKELFSYRRTLQHGFPHKPTALAWDPHLRLICLGTTSGTVKVFGKPGVEFYGQHQPAHNVIRALFLRPPHDGRLVTLCDDNTLHLWEVNKSSLVEVKTQSMDGKQKRISCMCAETESGKRLLLGTEGGNIYHLDLDNFTLTPDVIYQEVVLQSAPADYKLNPGAVEAICEQPSDAHTNCILIGYNRGLIVLWNRTENTALKYFVSLQQLESLVWHEDGQFFTTSHNDGSYVTWDSKDNTEKPVGDIHSPYGPYPCRAILKIECYELNAQPLVVFTGGLPRSAGTDKYTVSMLFGKENVVFDFTSKVIDFAVIKARPSNKTTESSSTDLKATTDTENNNDTAATSPIALAILCEEELVVIDLRRPGEWKMMNLPYLVSLHASAVTCSQHVAGVPDELWQKLRKAGHKQIEHLYAAIPDGVTEEEYWPIDGGHLLCAKLGERRPAHHDKHELLLTGHEDGTVRFWDASGPTLTPIYKFSTAHLFSGDGEFEDEVSPDADDAEEQEWPPYRKIGVFDPYSDDPRLAVKKVVMCPLSDTLVVAGTAGHIIIATFDTDDAKVSTMPPIATTTMNIVNDRDGFVWKGHAQLTLRTTAISSNGLTMSSPAQYNANFTSDCGGFQTHTVLQLYPPAAVTACVLQADWGLVAAGTAHGLAVFDYLKNRPVLVKCTLNPNDLTGSGDAPISRRKSFKKSLRESFRRLRKGRSQRQRTNTTGGTGPASTTTTSPPAFKRNINTGTAPPSANTEEISPLDAKPVERQIEARPVDDAMGSFVRCLYFARTFLVNAHNTNPTLWAGTNNGTVYTFTISIPSGPAANSASGGTLRRRQSADPGANVVCHIAKEIQLKHRAPIIGIAVLDGANRPLPEPFEVEKGVAPLPDTTSGPHRVIIASEEQFKIFTLPAVKAYCKYKLTAHEGARVRRMAFGHFRCSYQSASATTPTSTTNDSHQLNAVQSNHTSSGGSSNKSTGHAEDTQPTSTTATDAALHKVHSEIDLLCLTNLGDCLVLSVPDLRRQLNAAAIKREDINGISSLIFTKDAEAFYLHSSSEFQRISLATSRVTSARCYLPLASKQLPNITESSHQSSSSTLIDSTTSDKKNATEQSGIDEEGDDAKTNTKCSRTPASSAHAFLNGDRIDEGDEEQEEDANNIERKEKGEHFKSKMPSDQQNGLMACPTATDCNGLKMATSGSAGSASPALMVQENGGGDSMCSASSGSLLQLHNVTVASSIGDMTIDSVRDYLATGGSDIDDLDRSRISSVSANSVASFKAQPISLAQITATIPLSNGNNGGGDDNITGGTSVGNNGCATLVCSSPQQQQPVISVVDTPTPQTAVESNNVTGETEVNSTANVTENECSTAKGGRRRGSGDGGRRHSGGGGGGVNNSVSAGGGGGNRRRRNNKGSATAATKKNKS